MDIHAPPENLPRILDVTSNFHKLVLARIANKEYCPHAWHAGSGWNDEVIDVKCFLFLFAAEEASGY
jgi:hypothetical protein